jgi:hypothetical protein
MKIYDQNVHRMAKNRKLKKNEFCNYQQSLDYRCIQSYSNFQFKIFSETNVIFLF